MAFLEKSKKIDLVSPAEDLGVKVLIDLKEVELKDLILKNKENEEDILKDLIDTIFKTGSKKKEKAEDELENRRKRE